MKKTILGLAAVASLVGCQQSPRSALQNALPAIYQVDLGSGPFYRSSLITASPLGWSDADGDKPKYRYAWFVNGSPVTAATSNSLAADGLKKGDRVWAVVTPFDGFGEGAAVRSNTAEITGSLPKMLYATIGSGPYYKGDSITVQGHGDDEDGDPFNLHFAWFVNGVLVPDSDGPTLSGALLKRGDRVMARVIPTENTPVPSGAPVEQPGAPADSNVVTIANTPPSSPGVVVGPALTNAGTGMWATVVTASTDADGDTVHYVYDWYKNGELQDFALNATAVSGEYLSGGDHWTVAVSASDGYDMGWAALAAGPLVLLAPGEKLGGAFHTCMRLATPTLIRCWGRNNNMQLGDGTTTDRIFPVTIAPGGSVNVSRIALGDEHTCVLLSSGSVRCWGRNDYGQLGRGNTTTPLGDTGTAVSGIVGTPTELVAGSGHTCALTSTGAVYCWGLNDNGQLGNNSTVNSSTAVAAIGSGASAISAGGNRTCVITSGGALRCWGRDTPNSTNVLTPTDVAASGYNTTAGSVSVADAWVCARTSTKFVKCAGLPGYGATMIGVGANATGTGTVTSSGTRLTFTQSQSFATGTTVTVEGSSQVISSGSGTVWYTTSAFSPAVTGKQFTYVVPAQAESLVSGLSHTCMITTGTLALQCFGNNAEGQLGTGAADNLTTTEFTPALGFSSNTVAIGAGVNHTCGIKGPSGSAGGILFCWGNNTFGQLGNGSIGTKEQYPAGVGGWAVAIDGGNFNSCVVTEAGNVKCWGDNTYGQIGDNTTTQRPTPATVLDGDNAGAPLSDIVAVAVGGYHACALKSSGAAKCWGLNSSGQLGLGVGNTTDSLMAKTVYGGNTYAMITAGFAHTCGVTTAGAVHCWGRNTFGGIGDGTTTNRTIPTTATLSGGALAMSIAAGTGHTCVVTTAGGIQCWGANWAGQLGDGSYANRSTPVVIGAYTTGVRIATHDAHTCAQFRSRNTYCWGKNAGGQLGLGNQTAYNTPQHVVAVSGLGESIAVGFDHTCIMTISGGMKCWGRNKDGEVGVGDAAMRTSPVDVSTLGAGVIAIAAGGSHTCAITNGGLVKCWGRNEVGEIGNNTSASSATTPRKNPVLVSGQGSGVSGIGAGQNHSCDFKSGVAGYCWGQNGSGQLGDGTYTNAYTPVAISGLTNIVSVRGGNRATCVTLSDSTLRCWGAGDAVGTWNGSSCPNGNTPLSPVWNQGGTNSWGSLSGNFEHFCARNTTNGGLMCWGENSFGQLGLNNTGNQCLPQMAWNVRGNTEPIVAGSLSIRGGDEHTCVMSNGVYAGQERCWGRGSEGQIGDNGGTQRTYPTFANAWGGVAIGNGAHHSCMATPGANGVWCWGWNYFGQLGVNATNNRWTPNQVVGGAIAATPSQVEGGYAHTCAVSGGNLYCWGWNNENQLGLARGGNNCDYQNVTCYGNMTPGCNCGLPGGYTCDTNCASSTQCNRNDNQWGSCTGCSNCNYHYTCSQPQSYCVFQPTLVLAGVSKVSTRDCSTCIIKTDNNVYCAGRNNEGQCGNDFAQHASFTLVNGLTNPVSLIANGGRQTCVKDGSATPIKCFGDNEIGSLGRNTTGADQAAPAAVLAGSLPSEGANVTQMVAGDRHTCVLIGSGTGAGRVYCWGDNGSGQLGRGGVGGYNARPYPVLDPYGPTVGYSDDPGGYTGKVLDGVVQIGAGRNHTCALLNTGELYCWGNNSQGQIGIGSNNNTQGWPQTPYADSTVPGGVAMRGFNSEVLSGAQTVAAGGTHTCFILKTGRVRCMGDNDLGQLGTGEGFDYIVPRNINSQLLTNAVALAAGYRHTCAIQSGGTVYCWGENSEGQLGLGDQTARTTPTLVNLGGDTATKIYAGYSHTCVVTAAGNAKCWGRNIEGQIPNGTGLAPDLRTSPVLLQNAGATISGITELALGFGHTCYLAGGATYCVGDNGYGQVGDGVGGAAQTTPEDTSGNAGVLFTQVSVGNIHACGVGGGAAYCWGGNDYGQLGDGSKIHRGRPTIVPGLTSGVSAAYAGSQHSCALKSDGSVWCWGDNTYGQVGRTGTNLVSAVPVALAETATSLAVGAYHSCAVLTSGKVQCWGSNFTWQMGIGETALGNAPVLPSYVYTNAAGTTQLTGIASVSAGSYHTCAVTTGNKLYCWGNNGYGQLGNNVSGNRGYATFVKATAGGADLTGVAMVTAGDTHTCEVSTGGAMYCWGSDLEGQLGNDSAFGGTAQNPVLVLGGGSGVLTAAAGRLHTCAILTNGAAYCWGANTDYQLGDGTTSLRQPVASAVIAIGVGTANKATKIAVGSSSSCVVDTVNNLRCWGDNSYGQVGIWGPRAVMQY